MRARKGILIAPSKLPQNSLGVLQIPELFVASFSTAAPKKKSRLPA
jgi:hypothetical protein